MLNSRLIPTIAILLAVTMPVGADEVTESAPYQDSYGRFEIAFPSRPKVVKSTKKRTDGGITATIRYWTGDADSGWSVVCMIVPHDLETDAKATLPAGRDAAVKKLDGELLTSQETTVHGHFGLNFAIRLEDENIYRSRVFAVKNSLYQLIYVGGDGDVAAKETREFFDSFRLLK